LAFLLQEAVIQGKNNIQILTFSYDVINKTHVEPKVDEVSAMVYKHLKRVE